MDRREFISMLSAAGGGGGGVGIGPPHRAPRNHPPLFPPPLPPAADDALYDAPPFGDARVIHTCDTHAQLSPVYFREASVNLGLGDARGKPPHVVGRALLRRHAIAEDSRLAYALTHVNFDALAARYGRVGGFAPLTSLIRRLRGDYGVDKTLHLDGGDMWHGTATALRAQGGDMVKAANLLGVDAMVGHWEFTYPQEVIRRNIAAFNGDFLAQNVFVKDEALFDGAPAYDEDSGLAFKPYTMREVGGGRRIAVVGQAFPYTPISNPQRFIPHWTFGIRRDELQALVDDIRAREKPDAVILLSHNGSDLDFVIARDVRGVDFIMGGHTHDNLYEAREIGGTVVVNSGCVGKFAGCLDIAFGGGGVRDYRWRLLPVFADLLPADAEMTALIEREQAPDKAMLAEELAVTEGALYRRGNFNGSMDQLILDALRARYDADIALSPGFRWGPSVPAGGVVRMEDVMNATAMTYAETYSRGMQGAELKTILESVADNLYHPDPYYQQGGDMVRVGGMSYTLDPAAENGRRISDLRLANGKPLHADKTYTVTGWATQNPSAGAPVWEIVADYLRMRRTLPRLAVEQPRLKNVKDNAGLSDYPQSLLL